MQFEIQVGTDYVTVRFSNIKLKFKPLQRIWDIFQFLGGIQVSSSERESIWYFPTFITSEVLEEVIRNTCFVCGGLMKDSTAIVDHKFVYTDAGKELWKNSEFAKQVLVRKCQSCGHSHT